MCPLEAVETILKLFCRSTFKSYYIIMRQIVSNQIAMYLEENVK